jgi:hypothetical protein
MMLKFTRDQPALWRMPFARTIGANVYASDGDGGAVVLSVAETSNLHAWHMTAMVDAARTLSSGPKAKDALAYHRAWAHALERALRQFAAHRRSAPWFSGPEWAF